ncbi:MAG: transposase [Oligoflexales bacterium]|nr:transposase [Oligoflexales bacterium]
MTETAANLVDNVLPYIPYRQFVVSFPIPLRYWFNTNKKLYSKLHSIIIKEINQYYISKASCKDAKPGTISFTQRFGSALNLNPHLHILCEDGVYIDPSRSLRKTEKVVFRKAEPISDEELARLIKQMSYKVMAYLKRKGNLDKDGDIVSNPEVDNIYKDYESINQATASSLAGRIAFGPNAGKYVTRIGSGFGYGEETPLVKGKRCYSINGFSLHANTHINTHNRRGLEKLIRYISRGPLSNKRLEITKDENVKLQLKTPWVNGTSHLLFTPEEFIEKLCAFIIGLYS